MYQDSWVADNGWGTCDADWTQTGVGWRIHRDDIRFTPNQPPAATEEESTTVEEEEVVCAVKKDDNTETGKIRAQMGARARC